MDHSDLCYLPQLHELLAADVYRVRRTAYEILLALGVEKRDITEYLLKQLLAGREQQARQKAL